MTTDKIRSAVEVLNEDLADWKSTLQSYQADIKDSPDLKTSIERAKKRINALIFTISILNDYLPVSTPVTKECPKCKGKGRVNNGR